MTSLGFYKIPNNCVHRFPKDFLIHENAVDRARDLAQAVSALLVLTRQIADPCGGGGIASPQLGKDRVFLRMMVHLGGDFEIADDRANNVVVRTPPAVKNF